MLCFGLFPLFLAGVVLRVQLAIGFAADFANRFFGAGRFAALMPAGILANGANAVFELVVGFLDGNGAAAIPLLGVLCFGLFPFFLAGVVLRVQFAVGFAAYFANCLFLAGSRCDYCRPACREPRRCP